VLFGPKLMVNNSEFHDNVTYLNASVSALRWLSEFLEKRNCQDGKPNGHPLFTYRCTIKEYESLKSLLMKAENNVYGFNSHTGYVVDTENLFTLYCAEWWRRNYTGGVWKWAPIIESLGWDHNTWDTRTNFIVKGLRYWRRDLIRTGAGTQYLLSVACEGGIPINVLEKEGASFKYFLKAGVREYGHYASTGLSAERIARDNLHRLPASWQQEQIASLAAQIIEQIWILKSEIGDSNDPVKTLNETHPGWSKELPLELESEQAEKLINSLLTTARSVELGGNQVLRVERNLDLAQDGWVLSAKLLLPKELKVNQITAMCDVGSAHGRDEIPERMEMYRVIGDERVLVAKLSGDTDTRFIHPMPGSTKSFTDGAEKELGLSLVARGQDITSLSVAGAVELNPDMPWCFIMVDEDMKHFRWVGQGGCYRCEADIFVMSNSTPKSLTDDNNLGVDKVEENVLGKKLWVVSNPVEVIDEYDGEVFHIEPGLEGIAERDYRLIGTRQYFPKTQYPLYIFIPRIQIVSHDSVQTIASDEIFWRPIGMRKWRAYDEPLMLGDIELRHRYGGIALASWKLSILSDEAKIQIHPKSHLEGDLELIAPNAKAAIIKKVTGLEVSVEQINDGWQYNCKRYDVSIGIISGQIFWENERKITFSLPFPAQGASFVDNEGKELSSGDILTLSRLYGYQAQVVSPSSLKKYVLRISLVTENTSISAIEFHTVKCSLAAGKFGVSTLSLQQIKSDIDMLFSVSTGVNDQVRLDIVESSSLKAKASVLVEQFEGILYSDKTRKMIQLAVNNSIFKDDYRGFSLKLISINDIESDPITLAWNDVSAGWAIPDYSDVDFDSSHTYFASIDCEASQKIQLCVISPDYEPNLDVLTKLSRALTISNAEDRLENIHDYLSYLIESGSEDEWRELCEYLKRLSCVHPDGLDLVECILYFPELMAIVWFRSFSDSSLSDYLQKICETSPFAWWMISLEQWISALENWLLSLDDLDEAVKNIMVTECKKKLENMKNSNAEVDVIFEVLLERLGVDLPATSALSYVRNHPVDEIWLQLDDLCRGHFIPSVDGWWPKIGEVFELRNKLPSDIFHYIKWPADQMNYQKSVIHAPVVVASILHLNLNFDEHHRVAILAARNFSPTAFATLFRATQAILWVHKGELNNE